MTLQRLQQLLNAFPRLTITVVGDLFLDRWWEVDRTLDEPSVETGLTAYQVTGRRVSAGAAGTVINNLCCLGVRDVRVVSFVGEDGEGFEVTRLLRQKGVDTHWLLSDPRVMTPTYTKPMFRRPGQPEEEDNRFDIKNFAPTPEGLQQRLIACIEEAAAQSDALIVLDQLTETDTGVVTEAMRHALARVGEQRPELLIFADSRAFADRFTGVTIKCNDKEARALVTGQPEAAFSLEEMEHCLSELRRSTGRKAVVTCGARGVLVEERGKACLEPALPLEPGEPMDVCGCGDVCTSGIVSALCAGASWREAAQLGNLCSSVTIRKIGQTGTSSPEELLAQYRRFGL